jgi:uroporphyrin-3 C-methyltransferase
VTPESIESPPPPPPPALPREHRLGWAAGAVLAVISVVALVFAWRADQRLMSLEQELVRRQQDSANQAAEARNAARQAEEQVRDAVAKLALLEARVAEVAIQRTQFEELIASLSRSRDENIVVDVEAAIRVALQQSALTGSVEPLVAVLRQSDERLARYNQPRLQGVRRAIARDLDRAKAVGVSDIATLTIRLDEAIRLVDELPLLAEARRDDRRPAAAPVARAASAAASAPAGWRATWSDQWDKLSTAVWNEARALVRVSRIDAPEALLLQPEQSLFVRENLKLRLLNARLALLSRQFGTAQTDLVAAQGAIERYFDRNSRRVASTVEAIRQVAAQAKQVTLPRPEETLAALATAAAGR